MKLRSFILIFLGIALLSFSEVRTFAFSDGEFNDGYVATVKKASKIYQNPKSGSDTVKEILTGENLTTHLADAISIVDTIVDSKGKEWYRVIVNTIYYPTDEQAEVIDKNAPFYETTGYDNSNYSVFYEGYIPASKLVKNEFSMEQKEYLDIINEYLYIYQESGKETAEFSNADKQEFLKTCFNHYSKESYTKEEIKDLAVKFFSGSKFISNKFLKKYPLKDDIYDVSGNFSDYGTCYPGYKVNSISLKKGVYTIKCTMLVYEYDFNKNKTKKMKTGSYTVKLKKCEGEENNYYITGVTYKNTSLI